MQLRTLIVASALLAAVVLALVTSSAPRAAGGGLVASYAFDEGTGTTVRDSSGLNFGTTRDTTWTAAGKFGGALTFNGSSSWVTIPDVAALDLTKGFTIEAWVKPAADMGTAWQTIAFKEGAGDLVYALFANSDGAAPAASAAPGVRADLRGVAPLPPNVWSHVASTWDGSTLRLYVNGTQVSTRSVSGNLPATTGVLHLGGNAARGEWFKGQLDDLRIYAQNQSASKIANDMTTAVVPPPGAPPADITPPSTPTGLAATNVAATSVTVTWAPSTDNVGVTGYNLFLDGIAAGTAPAPVFTFGGLACGTTHVVGVEAFDAGGNPSGRSSLTVSTLTCPDTAAPSAPASFLPGTTGTDSIATSWAPSTDNVGVAGYTLYRDGVAAGTATSALFTFSGLVCGTSYVLAVEAFDAAGNVSARTSITAGTAQCPDLTPPSAPASFTPGTTGTTSIATSWAPSVDNVGVAGYKLYRDGVAAGTTAAPLFTFSGLVCATSYALGVEAFDAAGNVSARTTISAGTAPCPDLTAPSAPSSLAASAVTRTSLTLGWAASIDNVGVSGYRVFRDGVSAGTSTATTLAFTGLTCATSYVLAVEAFDAAGNTSARSTLTATTAACPDVTAPSAPASFTPGTTGTTSIATSWAASTDNVGVAGYSVYRDGLKAGTATSSLFTFSGLACGTSYLLGVEAFDAAGNVSARTTMTAATTACPDLTAPSAPSALTTGAATTASIPLSWAASADNVGVAGYTVLLDGVSVATTTATSFTFGGLACGTSHTLGVEAFDAAGNVSVRSTVTAATAACPDVTAPSTPAGLASSSVTGSSFTASWTASTDNVGVTGYTVFLDGASAGATTAPSFAFTALACGTTHVVGVQAFDAAGNVSALSTLSVSTTACPVDLTKPSAPTGFVVATPGKTTLAVAWTASTDNVGVAGYTLYRSGVSQGKTTGTTFTYTGVACSGAYNLGVEAFDAAGNVSARTTMSALTLPCPDTVVPSAPTGVIATTTGGTSIALAWNASTDNVGVTGYSVFSDGASAGTATTTSFTVSGLTCGTSHVLGVQAFDAAGNNSTRTSITLSTAACPETVPPSPPSGLSATAATTSLALSWAPSTDNVGVTGYSLFLDGTSAGATTTTSFTFTGLTCATSHVLGVQAFDAAGNVSTRTTATISTSACPDITPPSTPAGLAAGAATTTSIPLTWTASTDGVGVAGYRLYRDGTSAGTTTATSFTFAALSCATSYVLGVEAFDAAGNVSARATLTTATTACPDLTPPTAPASFAAGTGNATSIPTSWAPSTDNVAVAGYNVYRDGTNVATISGASVATAPTVNFTFAGLTCGTSYVLAVEAFDAAGNISARPSLTASTTACADTTPPQVSVTAPGAGTTVSATVRITASATDAGGVAAVQFLVDGVSLGAPVTAAPYAASWDTLAVANGAHVVAARATDNAGNSTTSTGVSVTVQNAAFDTTNAFKKVDVGPGFMDAALHGVIRTAGGRVYVFAADDTSQRKATGPGVIHAYRGAQLGIPLSFTEVDAAHRPSATGTTHVVGSPDVRLDKNGVAHMVYTDETNATLWYETFSTVTDTWGPRVSLATGVDIPAVAIKRETSNALVLDANDVPHVAYAGGGVVQYRDRVGGTWSSPVTVSSGGTPIHVSLAAAPDGTIDLAWLQGALAPSSIRFAQRSALGTWSAPETVATGDVLDNSNADQGPSVAFSATNEPYVLYVSALPVSAVRVRHRAGGTWTLDPTPADFFTHTPQIYMQGNDVYAFLGHDSQIRFAYAFHLAGQPWSSLTALTSTIDGTLDGSASVRFDPLHETNAGIIDATFWDEDQLNNKTYFPEAYYMAIVPSGTGGGTPPSSDTTAPTVSVTAPANGATVSGTAVALSATASDNVGVAGVQFKLDGANLGAELTAAPYQASWDTTTATNGAHTLTAVARDAAGNTASAASLTVTVSNAGAPPPPPPGTVLVGNAATEAKTDSDGAGQAEAFAAAAAVSGSVTHLRIFLDAGSTAGRVLVGLYTNNAAGHPGTLLTSGVITAPAAGQNNEVAVTAAAVTAGQTYWIAVLGTGGTVAFRDRAAVGAGSSEASGQVGLTALPATWTSGSSFADGLLSAVGLG